MAVSNTMVQTKSSHQQTWNFNLMFTNHGREDGIYPLKRDSKSQNKDQRSIVTTCKTPIKDLHFQLIENIIVQYKDET